MEPLLRVLLGYGALLLCLIVVILSFGSVQMLQGVVPDFELSGIRLLLQFVVTFILCKFNKTFHYVSITDYSWMSVAIFGYLVFNFGIFGATKCMSLADHGSMTSVLDFTGMAILYWVFKSEAPGKINLISISVCALGVVLTTQPSFIFPKPFDNSTQSDAHLPNCTGSGNPISECGANSADLQTNAYCYFLLVTGSMGASLYIFSLGHGLSHINLSVRLFWLSFGSFLLSVPMSIYTEELSIEFIFSYRQIILILCHCISAGLSLWLTVIVIDYLGGLRLTIGLTLAIVLELFCQYTLLKNYQPGRRNTLEVIGVIFVVFGMSIPGVYEMLKGKYAGPPYYEIKDLYRN